MKPSEIQTNETLQFVLQNAPPISSRILEVGCGTGELASQLHQREYRVIAIDSSSESIAQAKRLGIDAREASFPDFSEGPFDSILFTRSLHHIRPIEPALVQAWRLLNSSGRLIVEDFAYSDVDDFAAQWYYRLLTLLDACGVLLPAEETLGRKLLDGGGGISIWHDHVSEINSAAEVFQCIQDYFTVVSRSSAPYFYRYLSQMLPDDEKSGGIVQRCLELEKKMGEKIGTFLIGRRIVAFKDEDVGGPLVLEPHS